MPNKNNEPARLPDCHPDRKHLAKGLCKQCYDRNYGIANREHRNAVARKWSKTHPERRLEIKRKSLYGIDAATVRARLRAQDGLCKICRQAPATHQDHDHKTKIARGLLCGHCNRGLGLFGDDPERLRRAALYLELTWPPLWDDRAVQVEKNTGERRGRSLFEQELALEYLSDEQRHLVCLPYSVENLHRMAADLSIKRCWFHGSRRRDGDRDLPAGLAHYDIPKQRVEEIRSRTKVVSSKDIVRIIKGTYRQTPMEQ